MNRINCQIFEQHKIPTQTIKSPNSIQLISDNYNPVQIIIRQKTLATMQTSSKHSSPSTITLKHYHNSIFIGTFQNMNHTNIFKISQSLHSSNVTNKQRKRQNNVKNGPGLLIMDNNDILFGSWSNGDLFGQYAYISEENQVRMFGRVGVMGLEGFQVVKAISNQHHKQQSYSTVHNSNSNKNYNSESQSASLTNMTLYANFKNNQIIGNFVILMSENIYLCNSLSMNVSNIDQSFQILTKTRNTSKSTLPETLKKCFPYIKTFQIFEFIQQMLQASASTTPQLSKYYPRHYKHEIKGIYDKEQEKQKQQEKINYKFYGYSTLSHSNKCKQYQCGVIVVDDQIVCMGEFVDSRLHGIGKYSGDRWGADGEWVGGMMEGVAVKKVGRKWVYGVFRGGNNQVVQAFQEGTGWPKNIVKKMKNSLHMKSVHFDADFSQVRLTIPWQQLSRIAMSIKKIQQEEQKQKQNKIQNSTRIPHSFFHQNPAAPQQNHPPSRLSIFSPSLSTAQKAQIKKSSIQDRNYYTQNNRNFKTQSNQRNDQIIHYEGWKKQRQYVNSHFEKSFNDPQLHITEMKEFQELLSRYADQSTSKNHDDIGKWDKQVERLRARGQDGRRVWGKSETSKQGRFGAKKQVDVSQFSLQQLTRGEQKEYRTVKDEKKTRNSYQQPKPQRTRQTRANTIYQIINQHR